ncbi:MAG: DUF1492 domain-containing protein [bacterium]|nr:DUF1492 domain-containing protein [bacterium]
MALHNTTQVLQQDYRELIKRRNFLELARLIDKTKTPPSDSIVRMGYKTYLTEAGGNKVKLFLLMKLKEISGVAPDKEVCKQACRISLVMDTPQILEALIKRIGIDKSIFSDMAADLQKTFTTYVAEGKFMDIFKLIEVTGVSPDEEIIQAGYRTYLKNLKFISFTGLMKRTGIEPEKDMIMEIYSQYHRSLHDCPEEETDSWLRRLKKLRKISGVEPPEDIAFELDAGF